MDLYRCCTLQRLYPYTFRSTLPRPRRIEFVIRLLAVMLMVGLFGLTGVAAVRVGAEPRDRTVTEPVSSPGKAYARDDAVAGNAPTGSVTGLYRNHTAAYWAWRYRTRTRQLQAVKAQVKRRWHPTVDYALRLASSVSGVSYSQLREVSWCESTHNPFATNGRYKGIFQLGWSPFGFSPYDPVANALSAALTVRHDGSWRQWECKP